MFSERFESSKYEVRKRVLPLLGNVCDIYDLKNECVFQARMGAWRLWQDIHLYPNKETSDSTRILTLKAKNVSRFSAAYDAIDAPAKTLIGTLKRQGVKSILKTKWTFINWDGEEYNFVEETLSQDVISNRLFGSPFPRRYIGQIGDAPVCAFEQIPNLLNFTIIVRFLPGSDRLFDHRIGLATAILLCLIEGKQRPWSLP